MDHDSTLQVRERRADPAARVRLPGETTCIEFGPIEMARLREQELAPLFLVCRGVQRGRPIPVREGVWTLGRGPVCDVSVQGRGISRTHLRVEYALRQGVTVSDDNSTNGVFVNGARTAQQRLHDRDAVQIGPETVLRLLYAPACETTLRMHQYEQSIVDDLTGVHNRRYLMDSLDHELAFALRHEQPLCLMLVDIDHFKRVNDRCGHLAGDAVLKQIAERIADAVRGEDVFARLGGEEFAIVTRGLDTDATGEAAERVRRLVAARAFPWQEEAIECTISIGGAMLRPTEDLDARVLLKRADDNLYRAKSGGRNRVVID
jgi:diguanylate cyclase (GGDEF)-like protein